MIKVGDRLQQARKKQGFTIEQVAKATKIRPEFLRALEAGEYKKLPSSAYIQGFLRNYAAYIGLPAKEILALFRREFDASEFLGVLPESFMHPHRRTFFSGFRLGGTTLVIGVILIFILGFVFYQYRAAFFSPMLSIDSPKENQKISTQSVRVVGKTDHNTIVTIDDTPAVVEDDGSFTKDVGLFAGNNTITAKAVNSFGRQSTVIRHVLVQ